MMASPQSVMADTTKVHVDGFRGIPWGSTKESIRSQYNSNSIDEVQQSGSTLFLSLVHQSMFGLEGDLWFVLNDGLLSRGIWEFPAKSRRLYWLGRHVARRDVVTVLSMLESKYGVPAGYRINGAVSGYVSRDKVYDDFGASYPVNNVDLWWVDSKGNAINVMLKAEPEVISVVYLSAAALEEGSKNNDH